MILIILVLTIIIAASSYQPPAQPPIDEIPPIDETPPPLDSEAFLEIRPIQISGVSNVSFIIHNISLLAAWQLSFDVLEGVQIIDYSIEHNIISKYHYLTFDRTNDPGRYGFCQIFTGGENTFNGTGLLATVLFNVTEPRLVPINQFDTKFLRWDQAAIPYNMTVI